MDDKPGFGALFPADLTDDASGGEAKGNNRSRISRRDWLLLLGTGAATLGTSAAGASSTASTAGAAQKTEKETPPSAAAVPSGVFEEIDKLKAQRVYAETPVQARLEYQETAASSDGKACQISLREDWDLAEADNALPPGKYSEKTDWVKVTMPRPVQYALMEAGKIPNLWYSDNFKRLQWIQKRDWHLRRRFTIPQAWNGSTIRLRFDGMDYRGMVWLDGVFLGTHEGMFGGPTFDITSKVTPGKQHELLVRLLHEEHDMKMVFVGMGHGSNTTTAKPDALDLSYVWGNRYRTIGLYQPIRLAATGQAYMEAPLVRTEGLAPKSASLWAQAMITNTGKEFEGVVEAQIIDLSNQQVVWQETSRQKVTPGDSFWERRITLEKPKLWWPNGLGSQPLYMLELKLLNGKEPMDTIRSRFGVRTLEMQRNAVDPESPRIHVSSYTRQTHEDEAFRYLWVVNGRPFYAKGTCWMTADDVLALTPQREEWLIRAAKMNGANLFRLNGGTSIFETEEFYNLCDEHGIIVWQELPLSSGGEAESWHRTNTAPLAVWREQIRQGVLRFRQHPSTGVYVGGNEFDAFGEGIEPLLGVAREILAGYDGGRPFRMASPCGGDWHAYAPFPAIWTADENWYHKVYGRGHYFISEWSFCNFSNLSLLKRILPATELDAKSVGYDQKAFLAAHPAFRDRCAEPDFSTGEMWNLISTYGDLSKANIAEMVEYSQMAEARRYGYIFEHWRAQFPYTGGQTVWTFNSLGPMASGWHYIDWFGQPQIAYYTTKRANEPVHVMADTGFFSWGPGERFRASIFAVNDAEEPLEGARVIARIFDRNMRQMREARWALSVPGGGHKSEAHDITWHIPPDTPESYFFLEVTLNGPGGAQRSRQIYWVRVLKELADPAARQKWQSAPVPEPLSKSGPWLKPQVAALRTSLTAQGDFHQKSATEAEVTVSVQNTGKKHAFPVRLAVLPDTYSVLWSDNYFWLPPGETATATGTVRLGMAGIDLLTNPPVAKAADLTVEVSAWNASPVTFRT